MAEGNPYGCIRSMTATASYTLEAVLAAVGLPVLQSLCLPLGPNVNAGEPWLFDPAEAIEARPGALLLAVGCRPRGSAANVVRAAAAAEFAAVIVKSYGEELAPIIAAAENARIALLLVDDEVPWPHLFSLLVAAASRGPAGRRQPFFGVVPGDLFALANAVASMVGGAITIEDMRQHVLAYSSIPGQPIDDPRREGILGRRVPEEFRLASMYEEVRQAESVVRVERDGVRSRLAVSIQAGDEPIGSIWAVEGDGGFPAGAEAALADAARLASLHLLRLRANQDVESAARSAALRVLLLGQGNARANALPSVDMHPLAVVAFQAIGRVRDDDSALLESAAHFVAVSCESAYRNAACLTLGETIYALLPTSGDGRDVLRAMVERIIDRAAASLHVRLRAGIGSAVADLGSVVTSRTDADLVLAVLASESNPATVATIADVRSRTVLLHLRNCVGDDPRMSLDVLDTIAAHDRDRGTDYIGTLRTYLDSLGDIPTAAERMFLHQNTFRHRMRRIAELFNVDVEDPDERLVLWLLLRISGD